MIAFQETWQYYRVTAGSVTVNPVATDTVYRNSDGTGAESTTFSYTWFSGTVQMQSQTESAPVVTSGQNGPDTADVTTTYFDANGNLTWVKDPDGYLQYAAYDPATGAQVTQIADVNTSDTATFTNLPSGWTTPTGGGLNLVTADQVDALGRTTQETSPGGNVTYTVYLDGEHEERIYPGWNGSTSTTTGPTQVLRQDAADGYTEALTMSATPSLTGGVPNGSESISGLQSLTRDYTNAAGQLTAQDAYFSLSGLTYSTGTIGTVSVNYYQTLDDYDAGGRLDRTETPTSTIYRTVYDSYGDKLSEWVGTNDTPSSGAWSPTNNDGTSNMVEVSSYQYDHGGVGDGNLTQQTAYPHDGTANRVTQYYYDWRDRLVAEKAGVESSETDGVNRPIIYTTYDNLNEAIETQEYDGDGVTISTVDGVPQAPDASLLRAQEIDSYDNQGRVYQTQVFDVNPSSGAVSSTALTTNYYYDHRGDPIAESDPGGLWTKDVYDGADRLITEYTTDGAGGASWADATSVTDDQVLGQVQTSYDADSNVIETVARQRFDDATGTGALGTPTSGVAARVYYSATYYDLADRPLADVNVGTNGGSVWTRPDDVPTGSDSVLVTSYSYNAAGEVQDVTDPLGIDTRTYYDALGRTTETIAHYTGSAETATADVATVYGYDGDNNLVFVIAYEPASAYQETEYIYGVTTANGSAVNSDDLLAAVEHPDVSTGAPSSSQKDMYTVNALGAVTATTDRNGNTHQYTYDVLGRLTSDAVTTLGAGVDGSIRRVAYAYDSQGNQYLVTSYSAASGGSIVNQVENVYNGLDQLTGQYQAVSGAVTIGTTPEVQYAYTEMADGVNNSRPVSMTYPSGFELDYNYGSSGSLNNSISRLSSLSNSTITLESYKYLGLDTVVERDHPQSGVNLTYLSQSGSTGAAGDKYVGLDRFGRVVDQNWYNTGTSASVDDFQYGYNADGDVLYKANAVNAAFSELFTYDGLHQLTSFQRGTLNSTKTGLSGTPSDSQAWTLDALGNATSITTNGTTQARTANQQNQYTAVGSTTTTYDANGDLTKDQNGQQYVYDAWNRLVTVKNSSSTTLAGYSYNGLGWRLTQTDGATTTDLYYSSAGQVLQEYVAGEVQAQNVWSPVYVNALVLRDQSSADNGVLDQRLYVVQDVNWNVTALVSASGSVVERYDYEPYGTVTVLAPDWSVRGSSAYAMPYLWQGERYDATAGLYHTMYRDVSPTLERPLQPDPSGLAPDINDYRWERNNPTNAVDPSGLRVYAIGIGGGFTFGMGASGGIYYMWDDCGNSALVLNGSGRVGAQVGIGVSVIVAPDPTLTLGTYLNSRPITQVSGGPAGTTVGGGNAAAYSGNYGIGSALPGVTILPGGSVQVPGSGFNQVLYGNVVVSPPPPGSSVLNQWINTYLANPVNSGGQATGGFITTYVANPVNSAGQATGDFITTYVGNPVSNAAQGIGNFLSGK